MRTLTCTMITVKSLADAQVLIIGNDDLSDTILRILWNHGKPCHALLTSTAGLTGTTHYQGVQYITMMNADGPTPAVNQTQCKFIQKVYLFIGPRLYLGSTSKTNLSDNVGSS